MSRMNKCTGILMMWVFIGALFEMRQRLKEDYKDVITFLMLLGIDILKNKWVGSSSHLYTLYFYPFSTCEIGQDMVAWQKWRCTNSHLQKKSQFRCALSICDVYNARLCVFSSEKWKNFFLGNVMDFFWRFSIFWKCNGKFQIWIFLEM